jgi:type II secretory pathway pseudopilin PulG
MSQTGNNRHSNHAGASGSKLQAPSYKLEQLPVACSLQPATFSMGLTLIEVLMSVVLLSTGAVFIMQALARISYAQAVAEDRRTVYLFAISKMAEVALAVEQGTLSEDGERGSFRIGPRAFSWNATAEPLDDDPQGASVVLTTAWQRGSADFSHHVTTIVRTPHASTQQ